MTLKSLLGGVALLTLGSLPALSGEVRLYSWEAYFGPDSIKAFETSLTSEGASPIEIEVTFKGAPSMSYGIKDYPLAEKHPDKVKGARGKKLRDITLDALLAGDVTIEDLRITPTALGAQASVARARRAPAPRR